MNSGSDRCRRDGCTQPRTKYSVFCEEHHQEQLRQFALARDLSHDLSAEMRRRCERLLKACEQNAISKAELCSSLFDWFIHAHTRASAEHWHAALDSLPIDVLSDLLAYAKAHTEPRLFYPQTSDPERRGAEERAAMKARADLIARLREKPRSAT